MIQFFNVSRFSGKTMAIWSAMAFQAGAINAGGFLACHRFVTHITGFATHFGAETAMGNVSSALGMLSVPFYFIAGSMISAYFVDHQTARGKRPHYLIVLALISFLMFACTVLGAAGVFGVFGAPLALGRDYSLLAILCLASGIQNAAITSASGAAIRTTHLTGMSTDLGIGLMRMFAKSSQNEAAKAELQGNFIRIGLIVSFILGSMVGAALFLHVQYFGFLLPAGISFSLWLLGVWWFYRLPKQE